MNGPSMGVLACGDRARQQTSAFIVEALMKVVTLGTERQSLTDCGR